MKIFIKLMLLALVLSYASLFIIKKPDGTPIKTLDSLKPDVDFSAVSELPGKLQALFPGTDSSKDSLESGMEIQITPETIYRWQDELGSWHYSNSPPPGVAAEAMNLESPTVMTLYRESPEPTTDALENNNPGIGSTTAGQTTPGLLPGKIGEMQEVMQQARDVSGQLQEKMDRQQQILDEL